MAKRVLVPLDESRRPGARGVTPARHADLRARLAALARITRAPAPVVSVYLDTRWRDEHQRGRVRVFLADELRRARAHAVPALAADLDWIAAQGEAIVSQARRPGAHGVALFACGALGLREALPLRVAVENAFAVGDAPHLRPLARLVDETPATLVVFVDAERARLIELRADGVAPEVTLESAVPGHHRQGGWQLLAQSRYRRHIQAQRDRHFDAVASAVTALVDGHGVERIVLAGETRAVAVFGKRLEGRIARRVAGAVPGAKHEPASALVERAGALLGTARSETETAAVDAVLTEAAKGGLAMAGLEGVLEAAARGAVDRLYLAAAFREPGRECAGCGALQPGPAATCRRCGGATKDVELGEALVQRVLASGGNVETVDARGGLARAGGVAAQLRYPL